MSGKGDKRRPYDLKKWEEGWAAAFGRKGRRRFKDTIIHGNEKTVITRDEYGHLINAEILPIQ